MANAGLDFQLTGRSELDGGSKPGQKMQQDSVPNIRGLSG